MNIADLKRAKLETIVYKKHEHYVPTGVGEELIRRVGTPDSLIDMVSAANGIGKTALGVNIVSELCWPTDNGWFDFPLFNKWPYPKRIRIISDPATITSTIIPAMIEWFPRGRYKNDKKGKHHEYWWETDTGWIIEVMSYEQDPKEFESATLGFAWLDEPPPESIYKATVARLRKGGKLFITQTPLGGSAYLYDQIIVNKDNESGRRTWLEAGIESACLQHGVRGFLTHEHIEGIISQYSEEDKQARIYGKFQHLTGMIFKTWDRNVHIIRPFNISAREFCVYHALDPHPRTPDAALWVAVDREGTKFVIDELYLKCQDGTEELAENIKAKSDRYRVVHRQLDPSAFIPDQHTGKSLSMRLSAYGLQYQEGTKQRTQSDRRIQDALTYQKKNDEFIVTPELYVFDTCPRTIYEFEHYRWDEWTGKSADKHGQKEKPVDKDDHMIENLGRILFHEPVFVPYVLPSRAGAQGIGEVEESSLDPYAQ